MTHRPAPDLARLAASLRLMACGLMAELLGLLGFGQLAGALRRRMARDVAQLERFATGLVVLTALRTMPLPPHVRGPVGHRPLAAPPGFRPKAAADRAMRASSGASSRSGAIWRNASRCFTRSLRTWELGRRK